MQRHAGNCRRSGEGWERGRAIVRVYGDYDTKQVESAWKKPRTATAGVTYSYRWPLKVQNPNSPWRLYQICIPRGVMTHRFRPSTSPRRDESDVWHDITNHRWEINSVRKGYMLFLTAGITPLSTETSDEQTKERPLLKLWLIQNVFMQQSAG